ncbi:MAG: hypothetical protein KDE09_16115 [Anaerolineales bacterium]|nr:hypothetical protein [Anaerolineales bacterium]
MSALAPDRLAELLRQALAQDKTVFLQVSSGSMAPLLRAGDQIEVRAATVAELTVGDILLLEAPAALFSHRFWGTAAEAGESWLVTRGDRMLSFDPLWKSGQLLGKIIGWRREGRYYNLAGPAGQQLNELLARLSAAELNFFARLYNRPELAMLPAATGPALNFHQVDRSRLLTFLIRQLFKVRAKLIIRRQLARLLD